MSAYFKTVYRTVKDNLARFFSIMFIILIGVAFVAGLGTVPYKVEASMSKNFEERQIADIIVKTTSPLGFSESEEEQFRNIDGVKDSVLITSIDMELNGKNSRIYAMPFDSLTVNIPEIVEGRYPENDSEIAVERASDFVDEFQIGDKITILNESKTIVGILANPLLTNRGEEPDVNQQEALEVIVYFDSEKTALPFPKTDLYLRLSVAEGMNYYSDTYHETVQDAVDRCESTFSEEKYVYLTLEENVGCATLKSYNDKIRVISLIFPLFFIAVAALVVLTTMSRMLEEERSVIGCYKTLGFGNGKVAMKYVGFSLLCAFLGGGAGLAVGLYLLPHVIYPAFTLMFFVPAMSPLMDVTMGVVAAAAMLLTIAGVTAYLILKEMRGQPADLLRPKAPKAGKKIFLEKIPFFWNRLTFRFKSTFRNIFRYKKHFFMTVISVAGSAALILAGLGLKMGSSGEISADNELVGTSMSLIASVVIIFAILLCILVIFNLTNMIIGERKREIATLKVLGYKDVEVSGYIYREVLIMALIGILCGLPLGYGLLSFVFSYLEFGNIADVSWWTYLLTVALVLFVIGLVDWILSYKMKKIDMTSSLKTVE